MSGHIYEASRSKARQERPRLRSLVIATLSPVITIEIAAPVGEIPDEPILAMARLLDGVTEALRRRNSLFTFRAEAVYFY